MLFMLGGFRATGGTERGGGAAIGRGTVNEPRGVTLIRELGGVCSEGGAIEARAVCGRACCCCCSVGALS
jgi:hypothetical protein